MLYSYEKQDISFFTLSQRSITFKDDVHAISAELGQVSLELEQKREVICWEEFEKIIEEGQ